MPNTQYFKRIFLVLVALPGIFFLVKISVQAAPTPKPSATPVVKISSGPQLLITWKTNSLVPDLYNGKSLPTVGSDIIASFELIDNGKVADVSKESTYWYVNDNLLSNKPGVQLIRFNANITDSGFLSLRVELTNYREQLVVKTVNIPIMKPEVVVEAPYPNLQVFSSSVHLIAQPYYFNVGSSLDLVYRWRVNEAAPVNTEDPQVINIDIPASADSGYTIHALIDVSNPNTQNNTLALIDPGRAIVNSLFADISTYTDLVFIK